MTRSSRSSPTAACTGAITASGRFLTGLGELETRLRTGPRHPLLGAGSVHAGTISGGQEISTYPQQVTLTVERRTVPGETGADVEAELARLLAHAYQADPDIGYHLRPGVTRPPFEAVPGSPITAVMTAAAAVATGGPPVIRGEAFWTDATLLAAAGIDTVLFGVAGEGAHAAVEWVDLASLEQSTQALQLAITGYAHAS